jgi:hypothetical protein
VHQNELSEGPVVERFVHLLSLDNVDVKKHVFLALAKLSSRNGNYNQLLTFNGSENANQGSFAGRHQDCHHGVASRCCKRASNQGNSRVDWIYCRIHQQPGRRWFVLFVIQVSIVMDRAEITKLGGIQLLGSLLTHENTHTQSMVAMALARCLQDGKLPLI